MSEKHNIVTIDGPSGVGKSTVAGLLAKRLGFTYLDTGAMYRAVAYAVQQKGINSDDQRAIAGLLHTLTINLLPPDGEGEGVRVFVDGREITQFLRTQEIGMLASRISSLPVVRNKLTHLQRQIGQHGNIVAEGRDTGTVVFPDAAWKFYLDARPEERARRRAEQLAQRGVKVDQSKILEQILQRDHDDRTRTLAPLKAADDAVIIDSTSSSAENIVEQMLSIIKSRRQ